MGRYCGRVLWEGIVGRYCGMNVVGFVRPEVGVGDFLRFGGNKCQLNLQ